MSVLSLFQLSKFVFYVRVVFGELERKEEEKLTKILFFSTFRLLFLSFRFSTNECKETGEGFQDIFFSLSFLIFFELWKF